MKLLHLSLTKKWFDMILLRIKKEEYRTIKPFWIIRLIDIPNPQNNPDVDTAFFYLLLANPGNYIKIMQDAGATFKKFDAVCFTNGYGKKMPSFIIECKGISIGSPKSGHAESYAPAFVIKLGKILQPPQQLKPHKRTTPIRKKKPVKA